MPDIPKKQLKNILPKIFMFGIGLGIVSSAVYYLFVKWVRNYVKLKGWWTMLKLSEEIKNEFDRALKENPILTKVVLCLMIGLFIYYVGYEIGKFFAHLLYWWE